MASAGPYENHLHLAADTTMPAPNDSGRMLLLTPNQYCQSTEGNHLLLLHMKNALAVIRHSVYGWIWFSTYMAHTSVA